MLAQGVATIACEDEKAGRRLWARPAEPRTLVESGGSRRERGPAKAQYTGRDILISLRTVSQICHHSEVRRLPFFMKIPERANASGVYRGWFHRGNLEIMKKEFTR